MTAGGVGGTAWRELRSALARLLPIVAVVTCVVVIGAVLASAGSTLGYDLAAYTGAADRLLGGRPLYDPGVDVAGGFAIYLYPPPFALLAAPLAPLTSAFGPWPWILALVACFVGGVAILPVRAEVRWLVLLLGGLSWPLAYSLKLGQVGPILFLAFAAGWRWLDRPAPLGISIAVGTIVKVQPALLLGWALLTRRWLALTVGLATLAAAALIATVVTGAGTWADYLALLRRVSGAVTTPHNFSPGAIAYQAGIPADAATVLQWGSTVAALAVAVWAALRARDDVGYLTAVTASQLLSPLLWDHYAMLLLLPAAWLLEQRRPWGAAIPLATSVVALWLPAAIYPVVFWAALLGPIAVDRIERRRDPVGWAAGRPSAGSTAAAVPG